MYLKYLLLVCILVPKKFFYGLPWEYSGLQNFLSLKQGFSASALETFWVGSFFVVGLSYVSRDIHQHSWTLPTRYKWHPVPVMTIKTVSGHCLTVSWGMKTLPLPVENHWFKKSLLLFIRSNKLSLVLKIWFLGKCGRKSQWKINQ